MLDREYMRRLERKLAEQERRIAALEQEGNTQALLVVDGVSAPGATVGIVKIYVDGADGDLKVKFGDGTVATIAADT